MARYDYEGLLEENYDDLYEEYEEDLYEGDDHHMEMDDDEMEEGKHMHSEMDVEEMMDEMQDDLEEAYAEIDRLRLESQQKDDMLFRAGMSVSLLRAANRLGESRCIQMMSEIPHPSDFSDLVEFNQWVEDYALEVFNEDFNQGEGAPMYESRQRQPHNMLTESHHQVPQGNQGNPLGRHGAAIIGNFNTQMNSGGNL